MGLFSYTKPVFLSLKEFWCKCEMVWTLGPQIILLPWDTMETLESSIYLEELSYCMIALRDYILAILPTPLSLSASCTTKSWRVNNSQTFLLDSLEPPASMPSFIWAISPHILGRNKSLCPYFLSILSQRWVNKLINGPTVEGKTSSSWNCATSTLSPSGF